MCTLLNWLVTKNSWQVRWFCTDFPVAPALQRGRKPARSELRFVLHPCHPLRVRVSLLSVIRFTLWTVWMRQNSLAAAAMGYQPRHDRKNSNQESGLGKTTTMSSLLRACFGSSHCRWYDIRSLKPQSCGARDSRRGWSYLPRGSRSLWRPSSKEPPNL